MNTIARNRPFLPSDRKPGQVFERATLAAVRAAIDPEKLGAERIAKKLWPADTDTQMVLRAAVNPSDTANAASLSINTAGDFVASLVPSSAAARLIDAGLRLSLSGINTLSIPRRQGHKPASDIKWVSLGSPIPVKQYTLDSVTLGPTCKLPIMVGLSRELATFANGDEVIMTLVREDIAASLDASVFSNAAAVAGTRPAGLFYGLTPIIGEPTLSDAMLIDMGKLSGAISNAGGSGDYVYVMSPRQYGYAQLRLLVPRPPTIWPCASLPNGTVCCIDVGAFASAFGPTPRITSSTEATIVFDDTNPGTPTSTGPTRSAWQTDMIVIRAILDASWCMRANMVSVITDAHWGT
jgi:hypothetical protein